MTRVRGIQLAALFAVAAGVEFLFEGPLPRAITVVLFFCFFIVGMLTIASPEFLRGDVRDPEPDAARPEPEGDEPSSTKE